MMAMIATTIISSMRVKPLCFFTSNSPVARSLARAGVWEAGDRHRPSTPPGPTPLRERGRGAFTGFESRVETAGRSGSETAGRARVPRRPEPGARAAPDSRDGRPLPLICGLVICGPRICGYRTRGGSLRPGSSLPPFEPASRPAPGRLEGKGASGHAAGPSRRVPARRANEKGPRGRPRRAFVSRRRQPFEQ